MIGALSGAGTLNLGSGTLIAGVGNTSTTFSGSFVNGTPAPLKRPARAR